MIDPITPKGSRCLEEDAAEESRDQEEHGPHAEWLAPGGAEE